MLSVAEEKGETDVGRDTAWTLTQPPWNHPITYSFLGVIMNVVLTVQAIWGWISCYWQPGRPD